MILKEHFYLNIIKTGENWYLCDFPFAFNKKSDAVDHREIQYWKHKNANKIWTRNHFQTIRVSHGTVFTDGINVLINKDE